ncbi:unnamed protein product [Lampetra fluviatilis]
MRIPRRSERQPQLSWRSARTTGGSFRFLLFGRSKQQQQQQQEAHNDDATFADDDDDARGRRFRSYGHWRADECQVGLVEPGRARWLSHSPIGSDDVRARGLPMDRRRMGLGPREDGLGRVEGGDGEGRVAMGRGGGQSSDNAPLCEWSHNAQPRALSAQPRAPLRTRLRSARPRGLARAECGERWRSGERRCARYEPGGGLSSIRGTGPASEGGSGPRMGYLLRCVNIGKPGRQRRSACPHSLDDVSPIFVDFLGLSAPSCNAK